MNFCLTARLGSANRSTGLMDLLIRSRDAEGSEGIALDTSLISWDRYGDSICYLCKHNLDDQEYRLDDASKGKSNHDDTDENLENKAHFLIHHRN